MIRKKYLSACDWREVMAEAIGTFILVFAGTGAVMVNKISDGAITHLGISFVFGAVVAALIYALGHISGAHFNPAVTLAFCSSGFFPRYKVFPYILAQISGAVFASFTLRLSLGAIANRVLKTQKPVYLVKLSLYPGKIEFDYLPENTQGVICQPIGEKGALILGANAPRSYTRQDEKWISAIADKLAYTISQMTSYE